MARLDKLRWAVAIGLFLFGVSTTWFGTVKWGSLTFAVYLPVILLQFPRSPLSRSTGIWWGVFLALQSVISPWISNNYFLTLPPNYSRVFNVVDGLPGISGVQTVTTDHYGFRTTKAIDYDDASTLRIFAVGASTTEQIYLDDHSTWTHLLQKSLDSRFEDDVEVVNTGLSGTRARHNLATLRRIERLHPDIVLILVGINDWNRHITTSAMTKRQRFVTEYLAPLRLKKTLLGRTIESVRLQLQMSKRRQAAQEIEIETGEMYKDLRGSLGRKTVLNFNIGEVDESYADTLEKINQACHEGPFECVFITQPTGYSKNADESFAGGFWMTPPHRDFTLTLESMENIARTYNQYLRRFTAQNGHHLCDLALAIEPSHEFFYDDCHFNQTGARHAASILDQCLSDLLSQRGFVTAP